MERLLIAGLLVTLSLVSPQAVFAETLEEKIRILEERQAELYHSLKEKKSLILPGTFPTRYPSAA